jgi:hypothetical protein
MERTALTGAIDELFEQGPEAFADGGSVLGLLSAKARLEAFLAEAVAGFEASGEWRLSGACSARAWLMAEARLSEKEAGILLRRGRALSTLLPHTREAFEQGSITGAHVDTLVPLAKGRTAEALGRDEHVLVEAAIRCSHKGFTQFVEEWKQVVDPDGTDEAAERRKARRSVSLSESIGGMWFGSMTLDPVLGTIVFNELKRLERQLFAEEWAGARRRLGREPTTADLTRTPAQRRADALGVMARRSRTAPADGRKPEPLFTVLVNYEAVYGRLCQLAGGTVVPPGHLIPWLEHADIERAEYPLVKMGATATMKTVDCRSFEQAVTLPITRVECPPTDRFFTGATRRAIQVRDRICSHPSCDLPASWCEVDHIRPYSEGGATTQENGRLLCGKHNRMRNHTEHPPPKRE